jgi:hypothetical protein
MKYLLFLVAPAYIFAQTPAQPPEQSLFAQELVRLRSALASSYSLHNGKIIELSASFTDFLAEGDKLVLNQGGKIENALIEVGGLGRYKLNYTELKNRWLGGPQEFYIANKQLLFDGAKTAQILFRPRPANNPTAIRSLVTISGHPEGSIAYSMLHTGQFFTVANIFEDSGFALFQQLSALSNPSFSTEELSDGSVNYVFNGVASTKEGDTVVNHKVRIKNGLVLRYERTFLKGQKSVRKIFEVVSVTTVDGGLSFPERASLLEFQDDRMMRKFDLTVGKVKLMESTPSAFQLKIAPYSEVKDKRLNIEFVTQGDETVYNEASK